MKKVIFSVLAAIFATTSVLAQKSVDVPNNADKVVKIWNNTTAPHSNEETKDENLDKNNFPLLCHVDDIITKKLEVNIPWEKFTFEYNA